MPCGKSDRELWPHVEHADHKLNELPGGEERDRAGVAWHAAYDVWKAHADEPIAGLRLARDGDAFRIELTEGGITTSSLPQDVSTDERIAIVAGLIWNVEHPRRTLNIDAEETCDNAKRDGLPVLIAEIKRQRDAL
jgi:hypothetical protein